jgi:hypothetical protein
MRKEFLDLWIHEDEELSLLCGNIKTREKLHHWPLSFVEKIVLQDGTALVYKSQQIESTVEPQFYQTAKMNVTAAPFLLCPIWSGVYDNCSIMLLPYIHYPTMEGIAKDAAALDKIVSSISKQLQILKNVRLNDGTVNNGIVDGTVNDIPVFFDLSSPEKLQALTGEACTVLGNSQSDTSLLRKWVKEKSHNCYDDQEIGYVHGDLSGQNILVENGKPRYILDWQRPLLAPLKLENALAQLLAGHNVLQSYGDFGRMALLCQIIWYTTAYKKWIPFDPVLQNARKLTVALSTSVYV